jgi:hypothetical protein
MYTEVSRNEGYPQNGSFIMKNPIKIDDLGIPLFQQTSIYVYIYMNKYNLPKRLSRDTQPPQQFQTVPLRPEER